MDIITSHVNADFDAVASAFAAQKIYPDAVIVFPGSMEKRVRDFIDAFQPVELARFKDIPTDKVKKLIIVDTKHIDRIGHLSEFLCLPGIKIHIYDHHPIDDNDIRGELEVIENVGAVSTIFTEIIQKKKIPITPMDATILCLGIYEETGSLSFVSTTPRDMMAAAFLLKKGANLNIVSNFLKVELSTEEFALLTELVQSLHEVIVHGVRIKIGKGRIESFGDVAHLANKIMDMEETDAIIILIAMADKILIVARSKAPELDVSQVLAEFGGGGHPAAASATIKEVPFEIIEERLIKSLKKHVRPVKIASDVMTTPVIVIQWNSKIKEAEDMMTRYGVNVLPVVKNNKYTGILSREAVEKAIYHGFGGSKCVDFATSDAITVSPDAIISDVESCMIEQNQRFVPVIEGDKIKGAITRTDILRAIYEDFLRKNRITSRESEEHIAGIGKNIANALMERLPRDLYDMLKTAGDLADEHGFNIFLVGGCVRDILRGEENLDIDIVVEGDGIAFAKELGRKVNAKVKTHHRFGTAQVIKDSIKIDVATSRTEYYESPAALPKVETSSIKKDLYRRDFTINSLAIKINKMNFGLLIDFFGGQRDLKDKVIRVLHNLSFVEDPTRAFRAVRFSERFGFKLTKHTENLIKTALRMNIFEKLSGTRIYDEIKLAFNEADPIKVIKKLGSYDLLKVIHPKLRFSPKMEMLLQSIHDTISWFELLYLEEPYNKPMLYIMALLHSLNQTERGVALNRLSVMPKLKEEILKGIRSSDLILSKIRADDPVNIYRLLTGHDIEIILFCMAVTDDNEKKKAISHFLLELRNIKPSLTGEDLKMFGIPPGPVYSEIMRKILNEKLRKRLKNREEEIEFVNKTCLFK